MYGSISREPSTNTRSLIGSPSMTMRSVTRSRCGLV